MQRLNASPASLALTMLQYLTFDVPQPLVNKRDLVTLDCYTSLEIEWSLEVSLIA